MFFYQRPDWAQFRGRICGIPCYGRISGEHDADVLGTNWFFDWLIVWFVPGVQLVVDWVAVLIWGEPTPGFGIEIVEWYRHPGGTIDIEDTTDVGMDEDDISETKGTGLR